MLLALQLALEILCSFRRFVVRSESGLDPGISRDHDDDGAPIVPGLDVWKNQERKGQHCNPDHDPADRNPGTGASLLQGRLICLVY